MALGGTSKNLVGMSKRPGRGWDGAAAVCGGVALVRLVCAVGPTVAVVAAGVVISSAGRFVPCRLWKRSVLGS